MTRRKLRLYLRHPILWRRCIVDSRRYMADPHVPLNLTPGVLFTLRHGASGKRRRP